MLKHLFRLIWNKKKQNFLLLLEIFISFIGLFAGFTLGITLYNNYKQPAGFEYEHVWSVHFNGADEIKSADSLQISRTSLKSALLSMGGVEDVTYSSGNLPYSGNSSNNGITYNGNQVFANIYTAEDSYKNVLNMNVLEGRWFSSDDDAAGGRAVVINESLKEKLFGDQDALGKLVSTDAENRLKIVGVVADFKDKGQFDTPEPGIFLRMDTGDLRHINSMMIRVKPGAYAGLESRVYKTLSNTLDNSYIEIDHLTHMKAAKQKAMMVPFMILFVIAVFLLINVALGIFGVLWYNINKRRGEIGLRRAVGATGRSISVQLVVEAVLLATLSLVLGSFFAIQFPLLTVLDLPMSYFIYAIICAILFIYVLVIVCALYPGEQAAAIYPAVALHED